MELRQMAGYFQSNLIRLLLVVPPLVQSPGCGEGVNCMEGQGKDVLLIAITSIDSTQYQHLTPPLLPHNLPPSTSHNSSSSIVCCWATLLWVSRVGNISNR